MVTEYAEVVSKDHQRSVIKRANTKTGQQEET